MDLIKEIKKLQNSEIFKVVEKRIVEFENNGKRGNDVWFSELCFCILTANSKAETAIKIQNNLKYDGFVSLDEEILAKTIRTAGHRFHNNKAKFIVLARKYKNIKDILKKEEDPRKFLVQNIKGIGWKESSHFLRNVGFKKYAILDRHIINIMLENKIIDHKLIPNEKNYLGLEKRFNSIYDLDSARLDLYLWYLKTGKVLK